MSSNYQPLNKNEIPFTTEASKRQVRYTTPIQTAPKKVNS